MIDGTTINDLNTNVIQCKEKLAEIESSTKSAHKRLDGFERYTEAIIRISVAVENQTTKITEIIEMHKDEKERNDTQDNRIEKLENKPGQLALKAWFFIIASCASFILGYFFNTLGGK